MYSQKVSMPFFSCLLILKPSPRSSTSPKGLSIYFDQPQKAVAPGQVAALWDENGAGDAEWCLGCGVIDQATSVPEAMERKEKPMDEVVKDWQWW